MGKSYGVDQKELGVDVILNNVGVTPEKPFPFYELHSDEWKHVFSVNVDGAFLGMQSDLRFMK